MIDVMFFASMAAMWLLPFICMYLYEKDVFVFEDTNYDNQHTEQWE